MRRIPDCRTPSDGAVMMLADADRLDIQRCWVAFYVELGYLPIYSDPAATVFDSPGRRRINHVLHLLLSVFTFGAWLVVWFALAATRPPVAVVRWRLTIDDYGFPRSSNLLHGPQYRNGQLGHIDARGRFRAWANSSGR